VLRHLRAVVGDMLLGELGVQRVQEALAGSSLTQLDRRRLHRVLRVPPRRARTQVGRQLGAQARYEVRADADGPCVTFYVTPSPHSTTATT
jgi:hypothetical protein